MKSQEQFIAPESDYFIYSPSKLALDMFLYPVQCGIFSYMPGYSLTRKSFDSFLLMYIQKGELLLTFEDHTRKVTSGSFVLLDCYKQHSYSTSSGWECIWCHFDGITARSYYQSVVSRLSNVFSMTDPHPVLIKMTSIINCFYNAAFIQEPLLSKYLTDILTEFLLYTPLNKSSRTNMNMAEETISYINNHFQENITIEELAAHAGLSQYHFIRTFKSETGFTPHEYLVNTRIATAKYLLKTSQLPVKEICFSSGFSGENIFCSAFKRHLGMTPLQYRNSEES